MKSRIIHNSYVIGFLEAGLPEKEINKILLPEIDFFLEKNKNAKLMEDWTLNFDIIYNCIEDLVIARKNRSYPNEQYKDVRIHIPIPTIDVVDWGVMPDQCINYNHKYKTSKYVEFFTVNPTEFSDRTSFIIATMLIAIKEIFKLGVTVNGKRIVDKTLSEKNK